MAEMFGVRPWEWNLMTYYEAEQLISAIDARVAALSKKG